jgi:hypothetical protein
MRNTADKTRENRTITVDFQNEMTAFRQESRPVTNRSATMQLDSLRGCIDPSSAIYRIKPNLRMSWGAAYHISGWAGNDLGRAQFAAIRRRALLLCAPR